MNSSECCIFETMLQDRFIILGATGTIAFRMLLLCPPILLFAHRSSSHLPSSVCVSPIPLSRFFLPLLTSASRPVLLRFIPSGSLASYLRLARCSPFSSCRLLSGFAQRSLPLLCVALLVSLCRLPPCDLAAWNFSSCFLSTPCTSEFVRRAALLRRSIC